MAGSGRAAARPSRSSALGRTVSLSGCGRLAGDVVCTIRPSVAAIAGWAAGYSKTARAAALQARAKSMSRVASSGMSGAGASVSSAIMAQGQSHLRLGGAT